MHQFWCVAYCEHRNDRPTVEMSTNLSTVNGAVHLLA